jgi:GNAT superfamily N-acetyltransferase
MQSAAELERPPTTSGLAKPEFRWEKFSAIMRELPPLFRRHWREIALNQDHVPLDPDWDQYLTLELGGMLHVLTVRVKGVLVGYVFMLTFPHLHYASTAWAGTDIYWLDPTLRFGWTGVRMFRHVELRMRAMGIKVIAVNMKLHFEAGRGTIGKIFERLGYKPIETIYSKYLG